MAGMACVTEGFDEVGVAPDAAAVLRRGRPTATGAPRIPGALHPGQDRIDLDEVVPVIAEVVKIGDRRSRFRCGAFESQLPGVAVLEIGLDGRHLAWTVTTQRGVEQPEVRTVPLET